MMAGSARQRYDWLRLGFLADGVFKLIVAIGYLVVASVAVAALQVDLWLVVATATAMAASAVAEVVFAVRRATRSHVPHLMVFDSGWLVVTVVAILLAGRGIDAVPGQLWFGYQLLAAPVVAVLFLMGARRTPA